MVSRNQRQAFDRVLETVISELPVSLHKKLEEVPVIVEDDPTPKLLADLGLAEDEMMLCGLHWGMPLVQRGGDGAVVLPDQIMLFRRPILHLAAVSSTGRSRLDRLELAGQIRITLLHEIGHHFGLGEDDLSALGYA